MRKEVLGVPPIVSFKLIAVLTFAGVYLLIMLGLRELTVASLAGVATLLLTGVLSWKEALGYVDFDVLGMLIGVMIMIRMLSDLGFFRWLGIHFSAPAHSNQHHSAQADQPHPHMSQHDQVPGQEIRGCPFPPETARP